MSFELKYFKDLIIYEIMKYIFIIMMVMNINVICIDWLRFQ